MPTVNKPELSWLSDTSVFAVNRLPAHSDHAYYRTIEEAAAGKSMSMRQSLNGAWKFHYGVNPASRPADFYLTEFDCSGWTDIQVPGHIQLQGHGQPQYVNTMYPWDGIEELRPPHISETHNAVGSYARDFEVSADLRNSPLFISFQGVETAFYVWLNGQFVGYSEDSFTPSEFELTPYVREGENKLAVEVYQRSTGSWLEDQDFWRFSGIFREVYLYTVPELHVRDMRIGAELDASYTQGTLNVELDFLQRPEEGAKAVLTLLSAEGREVFTCFAATDGSTTDLKLQATLRQPELWSAEKPYLYRLRIDIFDGEGRLLEAIPSKVGFRRFEMSDKIMKINGKRIVFKGVNRHEFNCRTGRAISKEDMLWDIKTLKQNNINAVRTSHYPNQSYWYELCDEYGVYVIDEMNLETHGSWQKMGAVEPSWNIPGSKPEWQDIVMDRAISMYERDKNHPSILIWSLGNESYVGDVLVNVSRYFRSVDSSRLVHYEGVFYDRSFTEASDMESRMYAKPADIERYLNDKPDKPYISCEYMHAMGNSLGGMKKYTDLEERYELYQGGFIWDYIDQSLVKKDRYGKEFLAYGGDFGDRPTDYGFCTNGIVYADRRLSPKMQEVKYLYQNIKLFPQKDGVLIRNGNLFADTSGLKLLCVLSRDGHEIARLERENVVVAAGEERFLAYELTGKLEGSGEYAIDAAFLLKDDALWAEAGFETAFGQLVFMAEASDHEKASGRHTSSAEAVSANHQTEIASPRGPKLRIANGDVNIGVHGSDFSAIFSKQAMSLVSLRYAGREMIAVPPAPLFWRATTDNDRGFSQGFASGAWFAASLARKCIGIDTEELEEGFRIVYRYRFSISEQAEASIAYTVRSDGSILVDASYAGAEGLPQLPTYAVSFRIPAEYEELEWLAMGPEENYTDRANGARLGLFRNRASDQVSGYVMPQESGNRTGVRNLDITDKLGGGIRIRSEGETVECCVSPYTAFELENALHHYELPVPHYTVITVAGKQMGVGGDDSWGAPVHEEFTLRGDENRSFSFVIERL
ncbi:glycoside hydrolase family 2 TIM barrel-domain containing protein [Paenibacillus sp. HB172176]|uniref:glycoside hydrolase family 2 TIM barrel-domain containing protein n=1 Tax=Paenibacillus sp. HB172176 TaxID=2493690 RepID=UPI001439A97F|nr:glycoside hydrolase family 2 TIM barrel-domain containing protein [Paenibacillus sp. HB172176]